MAVHDRSGRNREERGPDDVRALCRAGGTHARDVGCEQGTDRRPERGAYPADDLGGEENAEGAALDGGGFQLRSLPGA